MALVLGVGVLSGCESVVAPTAAAPIRAAFYYPWFPEGWVQQGQDPFTNYVPSRGFYGTDVATVASQIAEMQYAHISAGIASWFGPGTLTDRHWPALMQAAQGTGFAWAPYYEREGLSDPSPQQIADDLHYLWTTYRASDSGLLYVAGRGMVVFVYNADDGSRAKGCDTIARWTQARRLLHDQHAEGFYVDLRVFPGFRSCPGADAIDGWHQYLPYFPNEGTTDAPGAGSYTISPGYWKSGAAYGAPRFLARDGDRWKDSIARMQASGAAWQLITTYNEWGEGTAIEGSSGCRAPSPLGALCAWRDGPVGSQYLAALHDAPPPGAAP
jgi:hypothetical protein